jgi:peptide subunit release factor 1 (eRF1)
MTVELTRADALVEALDRLSRIEIKLPVLSLYLDARPDSRGRDHYLPFVRKELAAKQRTYPLRSAERRSFDEDMEKIEAYLQEQVDPASNGIAIFACSGEAPSADKSLFETLQTERSFEENRLFVAEIPQLYLLARLIDENPRYAIVLADRRSAQIEVLARGTRLDETQVASPIRSRPHAGGVSQLRYQRHFDELVHEHVHEIVERLARIVDGDRVAHVVLFGDDVIVAKIRAELPKRVAAMVVDALHFDRKGKPEKDMIAAAAEALRQWDAKTDAEKIERLVGEYRKGGLAVVGPEDVRQALRLGQADEILVSAALGGEKPKAEEEAGELIAMARRTGARVTFIEDGNLLPPFAEVAAFLRYPLPPDLPDAV